MSAHHQTQPALTIDVHSPIDGTLLDAVEIFDTQRTHAAVKRARIAQQAWAALAMEQRTERLARFRDALMARSEELIDLLVREGGKPRQEALVHELAVLLNSTNWLCREAPRILAPRELSHHLLRHRRSVVQLVPRGVIGIISPWNFPLVIPLGEAVAALATGAAVVIKPSELTPLIALKAKEIWDGAGLPPDVLQIVTGRRETGEALISADIDLLLFTGSVATGREVAAACGARLIPCLLELGGKAPLIACHDCDLERTAHAIVYGGFANSGQACIAVERVYAHKDIHDALLAKVVALIETLRPGDPARGDVDMGVLIHPAQPALLDAQVKDAITRGASLKTGGFAIEGRGRQYAPTILADCDESMAVMREEIFGPVVPFARIDDDEDAILRANDSPLGLNAYVFTRDRARGMRIANRIEAGSVLINDVLSNYASEAPFGGMKQSGYGRVHGEEALRALMQIRTVSVDRIPAPTRDPHWFPYSDATVQLVQKAMRLLLPRTSLLHRFSELL